MGCPICSNDAPNCDCTPEERRMHEEIEELRMDANEHVRMFLDRVAALEAVVPRWIPVAERLPEQGVRVLVYDGDFRQCEIGDYYADTGRAGSEVLRPTHWMPLPPPPSENAP